MPAGTTPEQLVLEDDDTALYSATDIGLDADAFVYTEVDPQLVNSDRLHYQRRLDEGRADELVHGPRKRLRKHIGLLAERPDNTLWVIDGQHHVEAGVVADVPVMRFYKFSSPGWELEKDIFDRLADWRSKQGGVDHIAPYVRASFANGWAEAGDEALPIPEHVGARLREAVSWAIANAHRPGVLEAVRRDGRLAGVQVALDRRRDQLEARWDRSLRDVLRQVGREIAPAIARSVIGAREDDDQPATVDRQAIADAVDAALASIADGTVMTEWRRTAGAAVREGRAEGTVRAQAYLAHAAGDPIPSFDHAFADALEQLGDEWADAATWMGRMTDGLSFSLTSAVAGAVREGADYSGLLDVVDQAIDDGSDAELWLNQAIGSAVIDSSLDTYSANDVAEVDLLLSPGACPDCEDIEANNPWPTDDPPDVPVHPNCRCDLAPHV